jgi:hypothetical protein
MALLQTLTDGFQAGSVNTSKWVAAPETNTSVTQSSGGLNLIGPTSGNLGYAIVESVSTYDLTDSYGYCSVSSVGFTGSSNCDTSMLRVFQDASNDLTWYVSGSGINARKKVGGGSSVVFSTTYNASTHRWVRIRHLSSDGKVYFDTAPSSASDPPLSGDWVNRWNEAAPITITALKVHFDCGAWASTSPNDVGTAIIDCFNSATTAVDGSIALASIDLSKFPKPKLRALA